MRVFHDYMPADFQARTEPADLIEMELAYRRHPTFAGLGRYLHWLCRHAEPAGRFPCRPARFTLALPYLRGLPEPEPHTDESAPIPPAPPVEQIQAPTYRRAPDFSSYQHWSWRSPPAGTASISGEELQEMVAGALDQRGLRPAFRAMLRAMYGSAPAPAKTRVRQTYDNYGYGPHVGVSRYGGGYGTGYGVGTSVPIVRNYEEEVVSVRIEMFDAASGQSVWSNRAEARLSGSRAKQQDAMRQAVERALADYPPR